MRDKFGQPWGLTLPPIFSGVTKKGQQDWVISKEEEGITGPIPGLPSLHTKKLSLPWGCISILFPQNLSI